MGGYFAGVDIGSISTDVVIVDDSGKIMGYAIEATGAEGKKAMERAFREALEKARVQHGQIAKVVATGYGRERADADFKVTEITCHGRGAFQVFPSARTVIDIGGQDSKAISLDERGRVLNFVMNDKCAAGTGRFLEVMARAMEIEVSEMGELDLLSRKPLAVSSVCTVFAESEIVGLLARGEKREDVIHAVHNSVTERIFGLASRVGLRPELALTGGVAKNRGIKRALEEKTGINILVPEEPQIIGAFGAALIAIEKESGG
jgi:(R)-2-hydroxyacyl-CoA dehydratese activating ATPase